MQTGWFKEVRVKDLDSHSLRALLTSRALLVKIKLDVEKPDPRPAQERRSRDRPCQVQCTNAADSLNTVPIGADTSRQTFLTIPQHA
jgi:hypothetical protein